MREGKWAEAEELLDETLAVARINQDGQWLRLAHGLLIECALLQGQRDQALAFHDGLMDDPDQRDKLVMPSPALAMLFLALGDVDRADGLIERGIEYWIERLGRERSDPALWDLIAVQGQVLAARGQWAEADAAFHDALTGARSTRYVLSEAQALQWHGEMLAARGDVNRARQRLQQARGIYLRVGAAPYIRQTEEALARLAL
jgi:tetratricopeptide (TPR) repeat protein